MDWQSESPELWAFLDSLHRGDILSGTVAAIERFGVFVALDDGPDHPTLPGVGFIVIPELSWRHFDAPTDVVEIGQRVSCEFLQFDTFNAEARLSLKALQPDPFQGFADRTLVGQELRGTVDRVLPFGVFVHVADGVVGLLPFRETHGRAPAASPSEDFEAGEEIAVVVTEIERPQRRVFLSRAEAVQREGVELHVAWSHSAFATFRRQLAQAEGFTLSETRGFGGERPWSDVSTSLEPLLDHPDDGGGELSPTECARLLPRLEAITDQWRNEADIPRAHIDAAQQLTVVMRLCIAKNVELLFLRRP